MSLSVRQTGLFNGSDFDASTPGALYEFVGFNGERSHAVYDDDAVASESEEQRPHTDACGQPKIDWHEIHDSQSRTALADHAFSQSTLAEIAADSAAGECLLAVERKQSADFANHFTCPELWLDCTVQSTPDYLCVLARDFASLHPDRSADSVFEDDGTEQEGEAGQVGTGGLPNDCTHEQRLFPSTESTDFSLSGSVNDTTSQPELCNVELSGKQDRDHGRTITLADYLNSLNDPDSSARLLKPVATLAHLRRMTDLAAPVSEPVLLLPTSRSPAPYPCPQNYRQSGRRAAANMTEGASESAVKPTTNGFTSPQPVLTTRVSKLAPDPTDYLLKRRAFLLERLVERYEELIKLMNEELKLTGEPPKNYLEYVNEHKASQEALRKLMASRMACEQNGSTGNVASAENAKPNAAPESKGQSAPTGTTPLPIYNSFRTGRLQPTGFLLSPKVVRKVSLKLSPSANNLLLNSQLSLCTQDASSLGEPESATDKRPPVDQFPARLGSRTRSHSVSKSTHKGSWRANPMDSWSKRKQAISSRLIRNKYRAGDKGLASSVPLSMSLSDLVPGSGRGDADVDADFTVTEDHLSGPVIDSDSLDGERTNGRASVTSSLLDGRAESPDRAQAVAWIDMQLHAVHKILEANRLCAAESNRKKAYQLACQKNLETIAQLERQKALLLQSKTHSDSDKASVDCISHTGDSVQSAPDPTTCNHRTTSDCDVLDPVWSNGSVWTKPCHGQKLIRTVSVERSSPNMIDGLNRRNPVVKSVTGLRTSSSQSASSPPTSRQGSAEADNRDRGARLDQAAFRRENAPETVVHSPTESVNNAMSRQGLNSTESNGSIRIINQTTPVYHPRVTALEGLDELTQPSAHRTTTTADTSGFCVGDATRPELPCDTGLGTPSGQSVHTDSGSDLSRGIEFFVDTRSISSAEQTAATSNPHPIQPWFPPSSTSPFVVSVPGTTERSNNFVRVYYDKQQQQRRQQEQQQRHHHHQQQQPTSGPHQAIIRSNNSGKSVAFIPRINGQRIVSSTGRASQQMEQGEGVLCSRLPAYRVECSRQSRTSSSMNGSCDSPSRSGLDQLSHLPRGITTVLGDTAFRHPVRPNMLPTEINRNSPERLIAVDRPLGYDFQSVGTQTSRAYYTVLPKLPGSVSSAWSSNRSGNRTPDPVPMINRHRSDNGSPVLSIRVKPHPPVRESIMSPLCAYSTNTQTTAAERQRIMVHSQSGELLSPRHPPAQMPKLTKSSSSAMVTPPHWYAPHELRSAQRF